MKEFFVIILAALTWLPGCVTQRRIAHTIEQTTAKIDSIVASIPPVDSIRPDLPLFTPDLVVVPNVTAAEPVSPPLPDTTLQIPADTSTITLSLDSIPTEGQTINSGPISFRVLPQTDTSTGKQTITVSAVTEPKNVDVFVTPTPQTVPEISSVSGYEFLLFIIAGLGLAAQMLIKWKSQRK